MCIMCLKTPCDSRCPNALEPKPIMKCAECGEEIYEGANYYDIGDGGDICKECMDDKSTSELMDLFGEQFSIAY